MRRRSLLTLGMFSSLAVLSLSLTACEDGPNQTYSPAPSSAGNNWNNGSPDAAVGTATGDYDAGFGQVTPLQLCTADEQRIRWANMLTQPLIPGDPTNGLHPTFAGLDLAGKDWGGMTYEVAQQILCSGIGTGLGSDGITPVLGACFGENCEVSFNYVPSTHVIGQLDIELGYTGAADFYSDPVQYGDGTMPKYQYHLVIGQEIQRNGVPFPLDWNDTGPTGSLQEFYNAQIYSYGGGIGTCGKPGKCPSYTTSNGGIWIKHPASYFAKSGGYDCGQDSSCLLYGPNVAGALGGQCYFGIRPLLTYWNFSCSTAIQPTVSIVDHFYYDFGKVLPFSHLAQDLRISQVGPTTHPRSNHPEDPPNCNQYLGLEFNTFLSTCLPNTTAVMRTGVPWQKLTGGSTHDVENIFFNVAGINMSWTDEAIQVPGSTAVVLDDYLPQKGDLATDWEFDVRTNSIPDNDNHTTQNAPSGQLRGTGLVQREWARLVQTDMNRILAAAHPSKAAKYTHVIGDPACRGDEYAQNAAGCTGFEGFAIGGMPEPTDNNSTVAPFNGVPGGDGCTKPTYTGGSCSAASPCFGNICDNILSAGGTAQGLFGYGAYGSTALAPGDPSSYFCNDPAQAGGLAGGCVDGPMWQNALTKVIAVLGLGNQKLLPYELSDRRYYFRWWGVAMIKYLEAFGNHPDAWCNTPGCTPTSGDNFVTAHAVATTGLDLTSLFFDNNYGAGFDKDEYIDRSVMSATDITGPSPGGTVIIPAKNIHGGPGPAANAIDYEYGSDTIAANQRYSIWTRRMDREEGAMFAAMLVNKADLPASENWVNITNLAGSPLLSNNYLSYECATQWPNVTIIDTKGNKIVDNQPWGSVCNLNCPNAIVFYPNNCPNPPGVGPDGTGTPELDQNDGLGGCGSTGCPGANGTTITAQPRLAAYPSVWGGTGGWCPNSGPAGDPEGDSYAATNPYTGGCVAAVVANSHGSIFKVGSVDDNNARIKFVPYAGHPNGQDPALLTAYVNLPNMDNPFDSNTDVKVSDGSKPNSKGAAINVTVPWIANVEGVGFSIPTSGTTSKFVQTAQLDFTGELETYLIDYVPWTDSNGVADGSIKIAAIEGDDFLGEVFLCQDTGSTGGTAGDSLGSQDLLGVHMYDSGKKVLDWMVNHPGTQDSCNLIVQYSQYGNYLDFIASISAGVVVGVSQGAGDGRITSVQVFDPSLASIP